MQHHVLAISPVGRPAPHVVPRQDDSPIAPRLPQQILARFGHHAGLVDLLARHHEGAGVDQDRVQLRVHPGWAVEQQQASLAGDGQAHELVDFKPGAADKLFLIKKLLHEPVELVLQVARHLRVNWNIAAQNVAPGGRHRTRQDTLQTPPRQAESERNTGDKRGDQDQGFHGKSCRGRDRGHAP